MADLVAQDDVERVEPEGYPVNERRVTARFLKTYHRKGQTYWRGSVVHNMPVSVAKDLKEKGIVEPVNSGDSEEDE